MQCVHRTQYAWLLLAGLALWPASAAAQSAIGGQVTDNTGGILPGVTVEASSPELIEGSRIAVTDGQGRYSIVNLRPGIYSLTFSLAGFGSVVQENYDLPSEFTAELDIQLSVGALEETVTVSGAAPTVDVQQAARVQVLSREVLDNVINTGSPWTQAMMVPGVSMAGVDVGGSRYVNDLQLEARGANAKHTTVMQEGMALDLIALEGVPVMYNQDLATQEMAVQAGGGGGNAEMQAGGVVMNIIPKEGGNTFSGQGYVGHTAGGWISNNYSDRLRQAGTTEAADFNKLFDYSGSIGGPIIQDKLWFHESLRYWGAWTPEPGWLFDDRSQFFNEEDIISTVTRFTFQANPNNKFSATLDRLNKRRGPYIDLPHEARYRGQWQASPESALIQSAFLLDDQRGPDPETARNYQNKGQGWHHAPYWQGQAKWTSTISSRLLFEAGYGSSGVADCCSDPQPNTVFPRWSQNWLQFVHKRDLDRNIQFDSVEDFSWNLPGERVMTNLSYVTGSHNFKTGISYAWGTAEQHRFNNGDISRINIRDGRAYEVLAGNYPFMRLNSVNETGWFVQDAWTIDRVTITGGLRADWLDGSVPPQRVPDGRFARGRDFAEVTCVPCWGPEWSPRIGVAWDVFGDARTALKFSTGKYLTPTTTALPNRVNPMALTTFALPWSDPNGDSIVQDHELDFNRLPANFGSRRLDDIDPDLVREWNIETSVSVERELTRNVSLSVGWYRRSFHDILFTDTGYEGMFIYNQNWEAPGSFRAVEVVNPLNGEVFNVYDLASADLAGQVDNLVTNPIGHTGVYNGIEVALNARLPGGGQLISSLTTQRKITSECDNRGDPNGDRFCDRTDMSRYNVSLPGGATVAYDGVDFKNDFKLGGYFPLPGGAQFSLVLNSVTGRLTGDIQRVDELLPVNWVINQNTVYTADGGAHGRSPTCQGATINGAPCMPGMPVIPDMVQSSITVPVAPAGTIHQLPRTNMLNFSFQRIFNAAGVELRPQLEIYNVTNTDVWYAEASTNYTSGVWAQPSRYVLGRMLRLSTQLSW